MVRKTAGTRNGHGEVLRMVSIIVCENGASESSLQKTLSAAAAATSDRIILIGRAAGETPAGVECIAPRESLAASMSLAIERAGSENVLFVDATSRADAMQLGEAIRSAARSTAAITSIPLELLGETIMLPELSMDSLVSTLASQEEWPTAIIAMRSSFVRPFLSSMIAPTIRAMLAQLIVRAVLESEHVERAGMHFRITSPELRPESLRLSMNERRDLLSMTVSSSNIEDLFPVHPWKAHQEESAAASYHALAALFIRFGDTDAALECLRLSDQLEDSPRSLALKGLISVIRGETLGAVANLVSSLQQYELRKRSDERHYLSFAPSNLERINTNLHAGLEALNKRDNETALARFAEAVFDFDPFYADLGVSAIPGAH